MTQSIEQVVHDLAEVTKEEKELKSKKDALRSDLFKFGVDDYAGKEYLLPTTTVTIPDSFWVSTGLGPHDFLDRSFPTWDVVSMERVEPQLITVFVLRKNPLYMPFKWEDDEVKLSKTAVEPTPEIDFETLKAEFPELFEAITVEVTERQLDGDRLKEAIDNNPEVHSILMRHTKYTREPQQRVGIKDAE